MVEEKRHISQNPESEIDFKKLLFKLLFNWYWIVLAALSGFSVSYLINRYTNPLFSVYTTLIINIDNNKAFFDKNLIEGLDLLQKSKNIENEIAILQSYQLNSKALKELDFGITYIGIGRIRDSEVYKPDDFYIDPDTNFVQRINLPFYLTFLPDNKIKIQLEGLETESIIEFYEWFENPWFRFRVVPRNPDKQLGKNGVNKYRIHFNSFEQLVNHYRSKLNIRLLAEEGTILVLSTSGEVPEKEMDYLNKLTETYIKTDLAEKRKIVEGAIEFIDNQLVAITDSLYRTELRLQNFRLENQLIDVDRESQVLFNKYEELQYQRAQENVKLQYLEYISKLVKSKQDQVALVSPSVAGFNDAVLSSLITQLNSLKSEKQSLDYSIKVEFSKIQILEQKIKGVEEAILQNVKTLIDQSQLVIKDLDQRIDKYFQELKRMPVNERLLLGIKRKFSLNENIYTFLLEKRAEAGIKKSSIMSDARVLDEASHYSVRYEAPKTGRNILIGVSIGGMIPILIILLFDYLNVKINDRREIESQTKVPILGSVGHNTTNTELVVHEKPRSSITESFRSIKTNLQFVTGQEGSKVILFTSAVSGEGKTFCSINLASAYATTGRKTVLIGLDLRRPRLHKEFGIEDNIGVTNYLYGKASLGDIIISTQIPNLDLIPSGTPPENPNQLIESKEFKDFIETLKQRYQILVFDTPPVALVSDAVYLSTFCDAAIFVIRLGYSNKATFNIVNDLYINRGINSLMITINDVKAGSYYGYSTEYGYAYSYGYHYGYGYGGYYSSYGNYYDDIKPPKTTLSSILKRIFFFQEK